MSDPTLIGASIPGGLEALKLFKKIRLGDCVLTPLPQDKAEALAVARYCRENRIVLYFKELLWRGTTDVCYTWRKKIPRSQFYSKAELDEIIDAAGEYYGARLTVAEIGGMLYWPKAYVIGKGVECYSAVRRSRTMREARDAYVEYVKHFIDFERKEIGKGPLLVLDSSVAFKYFAQAGSDILGLEVMPGDPHLMYAAIRGAARAYGRPWGAHIAMECYGGMSFDELWMKRWKTSLYHGYISGAGFVWPESGHWNYVQPPSLHSFDSPQVRRVRRILRETYQFSRVHRRPPKGPRVALGVVHGNLDGAPGLWNRYVWGQYRARKWLAGPAEKGWEFVDRFHRKEDWPKEAVAGEHDFSGNPPYGQYDVVPIEAPASVLKSYRCLLFLGWNTMTEEMYKKLKEYVTAGGHLLAYLPHLSTCTDRADEPRLFRNGDFRDLFGVKVLGKGKTDVMGFKCLARSSLPSYKFPLWRVATDPRFIGEVTPGKVKLTTGRILMAYDDFYYTAEEQLIRKPAVIENSLGKGKAFLVNLWQYPGDEGARRLTEDLLRVILDGEQGPIRLLASDRVRYAVYDGRLPGSRLPYSVVYLVNTDPDCPSPVQLWVRGRATRLFDVPANDTRIAYCVRDAVLVPEDRRVDLKSWRVGRTGHRIELYTVRGQALEIHNLGKVPARVSVNGRSRTCRSGEAVVMRVPRRADLSRRRFFAADFLEEPAAASS